MKNANQKSPGKSFYDLPNPKDELLKSDMMKKLSLKEKWLNEQSKPNLPAAPMEIEKTEKSTKDKNKNVNDDKKSFLDGIFSSVKQFIKHDKDKDKKSKSKSPDSIDDLENLVEVAKIDIDNFDELVVESDKPEPGCVNRRIQAFLQKQKSEEVRDGADNILNEIKEGNDKMAKQMREMEQRRFSANMNAIKSSVVDSKVASMKEVNLSKYFPSVQEKKPPAVAKNRDVKALKDVNLSKYFPQSPTGERKLGGSPTAGQSTTSSTAASPLLPRKNLNDVDISNYFPFPVTPQMSRKTSLSSTPPTSPMTENMPFLERRLSLINAIPPPPPPPIAKPNILSLQKVKPKAQQNEEVETKVEKTPTTSSAKKNDFNMFDQLIDGAMDLKKIDEKIESFDSLVKEVKLERSPSKEYEKIFDDGSGKSKSTSKSISPENLNTKKEKSPSKKSKKSKNKKTEILDNISVDPKILNNLKKEYERMVEEYERSSKSPESCEKVDEIVEDSNKLSSPPRLDNKRKSPQRFEDCKKFKEDAVEMKSCVQQVKEQLAEEESVISRLEKKYRWKAMIRPEEEEEENITAEEKKIEENSCVKQNSVIQRLEKKLREKRESLTQQNEDDFIKEHEKLKSVSLVNQIDKKNIEDEEKIHEIFDTLTMKDEKDDVKFEMLANEPQTSTPEKANKKSKKKKNDLLTSLNELPRENDFSFEFTPNDKITSEIPIIETNKKNVAKSREQSERSPKSTTVNDYSNLQVTQNSAEKRKSLHMDLVEIDLGISERPLNLNELFPQRRQSIESNQVSESQKLLLTSSRDSAYSGSRKSSAEEKDVTDSKIREKRPLSTGYLNVLKEISCGLIGIEDEPLTFIEPKQAKPKQAQVTLHKPYSAKENANTSYTKVLQDISKDLVGLDLQGMEHEKNYSQIIPPLVQDQIRKVPSSSNLNAQKDVELIDIKIPVPPSRRHKSVESSEATDLSYRRSRFLPASKSFDYETASGRTSKNSTEYYDHYYPVNSPYATANTSSAKRDAKVTITTRRASDDSAMIKPITKRFYELDETPLVPIRRHHAAVEQRRDDSEISDVLERGQKLHKRKESFMRDQLNELKNPYIREMLKQDVDNPLDMKDFEFIRKHPSTALPHSTHLSSYQRQVSSYTPPSRPSVSYSTSISHAPVSSYNRTSSHYPTTTSSYKPSSQVSSISHLNPQSDTAAKILTKSHTLSPHSSHSSNGVSYSRTRPFTSHSDSTRRGHYSHKKSSGSTRDACVIS